MDLTWIKHLKTQKEKDDFILVLKNNRYILDRLEDIIVEKLDGIFKEETKTSDFDTPNWSHKQAFRNGKKQACKEILDLISKKG